MKILLISANRQISPYPVYPLGLDYVAGAIADKHQVRIFDLLAASRDELGSLIADFVPDVIGVSCRNIDNTDYTAPMSFWTEYKELVAWLRARATQPQATQSRAVIVLGGCGFTMMPEVFLRETGADFGVVGEGERFALLLDALVAGRDPAACEGVIAPGKELAPPPPWLGMTRRRFMPHDGQRQYYLNHGGMLNLQTKRGCAFRCSYCSYPRIEGGRHRLFDPAAVASEAKRLETAGAKYLFFTDSAFNSDIVHSLAVAQALCQEKLSIPWGAFFAPLHLPAGYFAAMRAAGCRHIEFGSESLSDTMLLSYRKPFSTADVFVAHEQALAAGLRVAHYFLFGGVGESRQTLVETLDNLKKLQRTVFFLFTGVRVYPGTALYDAAVAANQVTAGDSLPEPVFYQPETIGLEEIAAFVRERAAGKSNWLSGSGSGAGGSTGSFAGDSAGGSGDLQEEITAKLYARGFTGPLWEFLIQ